MDPYKGSARWYWVSFNERALYSVSGLKGGSSWVFRALLGLSRQLGFRALGHAERRFRL